MAERVGFEPTVGLHPHMISSHADSATLASLRWPTSGIVSPPGHQRRRSVGFGAEPSPKGEAKPTLDVTQSPAAGRAKVGGEGGIRTHGAREGSTVFETARFNRSRTSPKAERGFYVTRRGQPKAAGWADGQEPSSRVGAPRRVAVTGAKKLAKSLVFR